MDPAQGPELARYAVINGGAVTTGIVLVVALTKFPAERGSSSWRSRSSWGSSSRCITTTDKAGRILRERRLDARAEPGNTFLVLVEDLGLAV